MSFFNSQDEKLPTIHKLLEPIFADQGHFTEGKKKKKSHWIIVITKPEGKIAQ